MVIVNAPLRADMFRTKAEGIGLTFVSKTGMKMSFSVPAGEDEAAKAAELGFEVPEGFLEELKAKGV